MPSQAPRGAVAIAGVEDAAAGAETQADAGIDCDDVAIAIIARGFAIAFGVASGFGSLAGNSCRYGHCLPMRQ